MNKDGAYDDYSGAADDIGDDNYGQGAYGDDYSAASQNNQDDRRDKPSGAKNDDPWGQQEDLGGKDFGGQDLRQPAHSASVDQTLEIDDREQALIAKEKQLMDKNQRIVNRERQVNEESIPEDNWPCALYAITYHSIKKEIPQQHQAFIRNHYRIVKLTIFTLFWNCCVVSILYLDNANGITSTNLLWSVIYAVTGIPGAWKLWYRAIFNAVKSEKTFKFLQYFIFGGAHTIFSIIACIGVVQTSMCGFLMFLDGMKLGTGYAICAMICFALWVIVALLSVIMFRRTWTIYRNRGGDLKSDAGQLGGQLAAQGLMAQQAQA